MTLPSIRLGSQACLLTNANRRAGLLEISSLPDISTSAVRSRGNGFGGAALELAPPSGFPAELGGCARAARSGKETAAISKATGASAGVRIQKACWHQSAARSRIWPPVVCRSVARGLSDAAAGDQLSRKRLVQLSQERAEGGVLAGFDPRAGQRHLAPADQLATFQAMPDADPPKGRFFF